MLKPLKRLQREVKRKNIFHSCCLAFRNRSSTQVALFALKVFLETAVQTTVDLKQKQLLLAKAYYEESYRISLKIYGPIHIHTVAAASQLVTVLSSLA
jgi:hypothetical protein